MTSKFTAILALLLIGSLTVSADVYTPKVTTSSFDVAPKTVIDSSKDQLFSDVTVDTISFSAGATNDTLYAWSLKGSDKGIITIYKKTLDASSFSTKGKDVTIKTSIKSLAPPSIVPGIGYLGFLTVNNAGKQSPAQMYFSVLSADATSDTVPTQVKLTNSQDSTVGFTPVNIWWQDDYFYVVYMSIKQDAQSGQGNQYSEGGEGSQPSATETGIYLQAVKGKDGSLLYKSPVQVVKGLSNPAGETAPIAGADKTSSASKIYVVYKDSNQQLTSQITVSISDGKVSDPVTLKSDTQSILYLPATIITADSVFGVAISKLVQSKSQRSAPQASLSAFYNGAVNSPKDLSLDTPKGYGAPALRAFNNKAGFAILASYGGENDAAYVVKVFNSDGSANSVQKTISQTQATLQFFQDASGAVYAGYASYDNDNGTLQKAFLGKLLA